ncbi:hypothetical protein LCGC14_1148750 [marine sediment metagenome]|uniref:Uncharacterized protein n=2 Tax=marine sediment metagenome TaxID=412755 RepID=A0A0F9LW65_9ZZZZ
MGRVGMIVSCDAMGDSPASHEGTYLEPDERDDEVLTLTRRQLRIIIREFLDLALPPVEQPIEDRINNALRLYVRLDNITPEEIAR